VGSFGTVLVNGQGRTLYLLSSERGGKVTCTSSNGCTAIWPPVVLPGGVSKAVAGSGVNASQLGVAMSPSGDHYVTYNGWPLYEYAGDHAGTANGAGITSFGGTWSPVTTSGNPASGSTGSTSTSGGGGGGGGY
jgi:predicted lipoprotein with Yx(FWY)xxD motif